MRVANYNVLQYYIGNNQQTIVTFLGGERLYFPPPLLLDLICPRYIMLDCKPVFKIRKSIYNSNCEFCTDFCKPNFRPFSELFEGQPHVRLVFGGYVFVVVAPSIRRRRQSTVTTLGLHCHYHIEAQTLSV